MLPPRPFLDAIVIRVLILWLFLHAASAGGSAQMEIPYPQSVIGSPYGSLWIIGAIVLVMRVEMWRRSEIVFLANLGHSFRRIALLVVGECLLLEAGLRVAVG